MALVATAEVVAEMGEEGLFGVLIVSVCVLSVFCLFVVVNGLGLLLLLLLRDLLCDLLGCELYL